MGAPHDHRAKAQTTRRRHRHDGRRPDSRRTRLAICSNRDPLNGWSFLSEAYFATDPDYRGRVTVPVLWDKHGRRIVSNDDDDIMRMFETAFDAFGDGALDLYPARHRAEIDALNELSVRDGQRRRVSRRFCHVASGLRTSGVPRLRYSRRNGRAARAPRYLFREHPVETDWRFFVTLVRFDAVYYGHFKCNLRRIVDYPNLSGYLRDLYQIDGSPRR